jgi:hypothetical protein
MSIIIDLPHNPNEPTLDEFVEEIEGTVPAQSVENSLTAAHAVEQLCVAVSYVCEFLGGRVPKRIRISEVLNLDCRAVAERVACDAGPEATAGITRCVRNLVQHARSFEGKCRGCHPASGRRSSNFCVDGSEHICDRTQFSVVSPWNLRSRFHY